MHYRFNSKGDNFNVKQLNILYYIKLQIKTKQKQNSRQMQTVLKNQGHKYVKRKTVKLSQVSLTILYIFRNKRI